MKVRYDFWNALLKLIIWYITHSVTRMINWFLEIDRNERRGWERKRSSGKFLLLFKVYGHEVTHQENDEHRNRCGGENYKVERIYLVDSVRWLYNGEITPVENRRPFLTPLVCAGCLLTGWKAVFARPNDAELLRTYPSKLPFIL